MEFENLNPQEVASPNTDQIAGNVKASVVGIAAAQSLVPLLAHVFLQRCTVFECLLTVKALQTLPNTTLHLQLQFKL